jgi:hypothetical protein
VCHVLVWLIIQSVYFQTPDHAISFANLGLERLRLSSYCFNSSIFQVLQKHPTPTKYFHSLAWFTPIFRLNLSRRVLIAKGQFLSAGHLPFTSLLISGAFLIPFSCTRILLSSRSLTQNLDNLLCPSLYLWSYPHYLFSYWVHLILERVLGWGGTLLVVSILYIFSWRYIL